MVTSQVMYGFFRTVPNMCMQQTCPFLQADLIRTTCIMYGYHWLVHNSVMKLAIKVISMRPCYVRQTMVKARARLVQNQSRSSTLNGII